jgi:hypothetical protein
MDRPIQKKIRSRFTPLSLGKRVARFIPFCGTGTGLFWKGWKFMF